jgi:hypothetical protein
MANLARWGAGRSYVTRVDAEVPTLFAAETRRLLNDSIVEERFRPRVKAWSPTLAGVDFAGAPELKGYVATKPKHFSDVLLEVKEGLPLLVETHYGLGKTVGFLSDVKNRWAADWLDWPGYARLWAQVVRDSAQRDSGEGVRWRVAREGRTALIDLTAPGSRSPNASGPGSRHAADGAAGCRHQVDRPLPCARSGVAGCAWRFELLPGGIVQPSCARAAARCSIPTRTRIACGREPAAPAR